MSEGEIAIQDYRKYNCDDESQWGQLLRLLCKQKTTNRRGVAQEVVNNQAANELDPLAVATGYSKLTDPFFIELKSNQVTRSLPLPVLTR